MWQRLSPPDTGPRIPTEHAMQVRAFLISIPVIASLACNDTPERVSQYATFRLTADLSALTENERQMIPILIGPNLALQLKVSA